MIGLGILFRYGGSEFTNYIGSGNVDKMYPVRVQSFVVCVFNHWAEMQQPIVFNSAGLDAVMEL